MTGRLVIAGTHSGVGKTAITSGILRALSRRGLELQPFKVGPDFIDPGYHRVACGQISRNLDVWLTSEETVVRIFDEAGEEADLSLVEGVMGLFDGSFDGGSGSTAHVAMLLNAPVILVVDARAMAQSVGALLKGFRDFQPELKVAGVIFNRVRSARHAAILTGEAERLGLIPIGAFPEMELEFRERHLGLVPAEERKKQVEVAIERLAEGASRLDLDALLEISGYRPHRAEKRVGAVTSKAAERAVKKNDKSRPRIGVARDEAFSFYYPENLEMLEESAELVFFSPLRDEKPPEVDGFYFGGGFPEVFADGLAENAGMRRAIERAILEGAPAYAECGGLVYLARELIGFEGKRHRMVGALDIACRMSEGVKLGYREVESIADTPIAPAGCVLRGHEFHYSEIVSDGEMRRAYRCRSSGEPEGYIKGSLLASYVHLHFAGKRSLVNRFIDECAGRGHG